MPTNQYETLLEHCYKTGVDKSDRTGVEIGRASCRERV